MDTYSNSDVHIERFLSASTTATALDTITAPLFHTDPTQTMLDALNLYQSLQAAEGRNDYFSFSHWSGGHSEFHHEGTTCLTLEYDAAHAPAVKAALEEMEFAHYVIPTKVRRSKAFLFAIPCSNELDVTDTTRAASLVAEMIEQGGLFGDSFKYTYFFRFRTDQQISFTPGKLMSSRFVREANNAKIKVFIKRWTR